MFRLRLGSIPLVVHFSHLLINLLFAWSFTQGAALSPDWPGPQLRASDGQGLYAALVATWAGLILLSILLHELGHALAARAFGYHPSIHLVGMGGLTQPNAPGEIPWKQDAVLTLAGPAFGLGLTVLAAGGWALFQLTGTHHSAAEYLLHDLAFINGFWTVLNLVPVTPLDGGRLAVVLLVRAMGRRGFYAAQGLALVSSLALVAVGLALNMPLVAMLFGLYGFRAVTMVMAARQGVAPLSGAAHPLQAQVENAERLYQEGRLDDAELEATRLATAEAPVLVRSRAHLLLGWLSIKRAKGREALDHFAQVQGVGVPPVAVAAALSLIGDDERALAAWESAARKTADPVVWHEFAGTLLRLGRDADVRRLPDVRPALAWAAAQRVFFLRKQFPEAAHASEEAFRVEPSARNAYDAACAWARAGDATAALRMLRLAAQNGFDQALEAESDPDLATLREIPEFRQWLAALPAHPAQ